MTTFGPLFVPPALLDAVSGRAWLEGMLEAEQALATAEAAWASSLPTRRSRSPSAATRALRLRRAARARTGGRKPRRASRARAAGRRSAAMPRATSTTARRARTSWTPRRCSSRAAPRSTSFSRISRPSKPGWPGSRRRTARRRWSPDPPPAGAADDVRAQGRRPARGAAGGARTPRRGPRRPPRRGARRRRGDARGARRPRAGGAPALRRRARLGSRPCFLAHESRDRRLGAALDVRGSAREDRPRPRPPCTDRGRRGTRGRHGQVVDPPVRSATRSARRTRACGGSSTTASVLARTVVQSTSARPALACGVDGALGSARVHGWRGCRDRRGAAGLEVDEERMRRNLELTDGLILSEQVALAVGGDGAHDVVREAALGAVASGRSFEEELRGSDRVSLSDEQLTEALDPATYIGSAEAFVDRALAEYRSRSRRRRAHEAGAQRRGRNQLRRSCSRARSGRRATCGAAASGPRPHFRVVRYDHPGHGESPRPTSRSRSRISRWKSWSCSTSSRSSRRPSAASRSAARSGWRSLARRIASTGSSSPARRRASASRRCGTTGLAPCVPVGPAAIADALLRRWFTAPFASDHADVAARFRAMLESVPSEGYAACCEALAEWDARESVRRIEAPTLVIAGAYDVATPQATPSTSPSRSPARGSRSSTTRRTSRTSSSRRHSTASCSSISPSPSERRGRRERPWARLRDRRGGARRRARRPRDRADQRIHRRLRSSSRATPGRDLGAARARPARPAACSRSACSSRSAARRSSRCTCAPRAGSASRRTRSRRSSCSAIYCGVPAANGAFKIAQEVLEETERKAPDAHAGRDRGRRPRGLTLAQLLHREGIESVVLEDRTRTTSSTESAQASSSRGRSTSSSTSGSASGCRRASSITGSRSSSTPSATACRSAISPAAARS